MSSFLALETIIPPLSGRMSSRQTLQGHLIHSDPPTAKYIPSRYIHGHPYGLRAAVCARSRECA